ncbi:MAG TPA: hypothetical protein VH704_15040 [Casimicrobiaceae bacterium]|nr:hypothetical protein [Casimicrobiaceae bacterium]
MMNAIKVRSIAALCALVAASAVALAPGPAAAHGLAGKRFFPATLATDDPFVADELSLPTIESRKMPASGDEPATRETGFSLDVSKRLTENLGIGFGATYKVLEPDGGDTQRGFDNLAASIKYKFYQNDEQETILSAGVDADIGGSGSKRVGAESFSTLTPALFFGKGFGDLPESVKFMRPLAVTGLVGLGIPTRSETTSTSEDGDVSVERHPHTLEWGFAIEYSLPYLQSFVQDVGLREPFSRMIPVVEFAMSTALDRGASGTTGTVNPGIIWAGRYTQLAVEAVIPVNNRSGNRVGWIAQLHFFLDDLFPTTIGRPIFGR